MPYISIFIHYVWSTKKRNHLLTATIRKALFAYILFNAKDKKICIDRINGHTNHVHCLVKLQTGQTIDGIIKLIKGESAHWFNKNHAPGKIQLQWQPDYFAVSVCRSTLDMVRTYIDEQEQHHSRKSFEQEYEEFMRKYEFVEDKVPRD